MGANGVKVFKIFDVRAYYEVEKFNILANENIHIWFKKRNLKNVRLSWEAVGAKSVIERWLNRVDANSILWDTKVVVGDKVHLVSCDDSSHQEL